ncbi:MAG: response regulator [Fidelibacterota bacterium]
MKFLIIEDEIIIADDLKFTVEQCGHKITGMVLEIEETFKNIDKHKPDSVFIDMGLKGEFTGVEVAEMIYRKYGIRVIFLTSFFQKVPEKAHYLNPYGFLIKPVIREEILQLIEKMKTSQQPANVVGEDNHYRQETFYTKLYNF